ncbi:MAG TPA: hypothetical protein VFN97_23770 [Actinospica sp.]|nr:hypothetical protein [Actinospica sp.]
MKKAAVALTALILGAVALAGCSSTAPAPDGEENAVLIESGNTGNVYWNLWAWEDGGRLCMGMGNRSSPYTARNGATAGAVYGSQCGFNAKTEGRTYYVSATNGTNGPPTVAVLFGPVPSAAVSVQVTSKITLKTTAFPSGAGLPSADYWFWAGPYQPPASDGTLLAVPRPVDAHGEQVAFQAY